MKKAGRGPLRNASCRWKMGPGKHFRFRRGVTEGLASIVNRTMYFGSLGKVLPSRHNVGCKLGATA